jgi:hypothetical protein
MVGASGRFGIGFIAGWACSRSGLARVIGAGAHHG